MDGQAGSGVDDAQGSAHTHQGCPSDQPDQSYARCVDGGFGADVLGGHVGHPGGIWDAHHAEDFCPCCKVSEGAMWAGHACIALLVLVLAMHDYLHAAELPSSHTAHENALALQGVACFL